MSFGSRSEESELRELVDEECPGSEISGKGSFTSLMDVLIWLEKAW